MARRWKLDAARRIYSGREGTPVDKKKFLFFSVLCLFKVVNDICSGLAATCTWMRCTLKLVRASRLRDVELVFFHLFFFLPSLVCVFVCASVSLAATDAGDCISSCKNGLVLNQRKGNATLQQVERLENHNKNQRWGWCRFSHVFVHMKYANVVYSPTSLWISPSLSFCASVCVCVSIIHSLPLYRTTHKYTQRTMYGRRKMYAIAMNKPCRKRTCEFLITRCGRTEAAGAWCRCRCRWRRRASWLIFFPQFCALANFFFIRIRFFSSWLPFRIYEYTSRRTQIDVIFVRNSMFWWLARQVRLRFQSMHAEFLNFDSSAFFSWLQPQACGKPNKLWILLQTSAAQPSPVSWMKISTVSPYSLHSKFNCVAFVIAAAVVVFWGWRAQSIDMAVDGMPLRCIPIFIVFTSTAHNAPIFRVDNRQSNGIGTALKIVRNEKWKKQKIN